MRWAARIGLLLVSLAVGNPAMAEPDYANTIRTVAREIAGLKKNFPELHGFSPAANLHDLTIDYAYHTHKATHHGGWTAGVPNPDDDGLWFYIDFHNADSIAQIDTQPMVGPAECLGKKHVAFLILTGSNTRPVSGPIWSILRKHGVKKCGNQPTSSPTKSP